MMGHLRDSASATASPTKWCACRKGTPLRTSQSARSVASRSGSAAARAQAARSTAMSPSISARMSSVDCTVARGVEERLLVLLQVAIIGHRQALEQRERGDEMADDAGGFAARQLGDVGILLLRHQAGAGGVGIADADETELGRGPEDKVLGQAREMHREQRAGGVIFDDEVAVADSVHRVFARRARSRVPSRRRRGRAAACCRRSRRSRAAGHRRARRNRPAGPHRARASPHRRADDARAAPAARAAGGCSRG